MCVDDGVLESKLLENDDELNDILKPFFRIIQVLYNRSFYIKKHVYALGIMGERKRWAATDMDRACVFQGGLFYYITDSSYTNFGILIKITDE